MNHSTCLRPRAQGWLRVGLLLALLGGCGGGVDSGGTGGATVYANGPINGYGSVIVNGVRFDESSSNISDDDGNARNRSDLKLGMVVEARGSAIALDRFGDAGSAASSIVIGSEIVGPIDAPPAANSFSVLGRSIDVPPTTVFADGATEGLDGGLTALVQGDVVEVYGLYDAFADRFTATRIERKSNPPHYRVRGKVSGRMDTEFLIGALLINYAAISINERPSDFGDGAVVRVRLSTTSPTPGGAWTANRLRGGVSTPDDGFESKLEGVIDSIATLMPTPQFSVNGIAVTTNAQTLIDQTNGALAVGVRVELEGRFVNGALAATEVEVEDPGGDDFDFRGALQSVDPGTKVLTMHGIAIDYSGTPEFKGGNEDNLVAGVNLRVRAVLVNGATYRAYLIEFRN